MSFGAQPIAANWDFSDLVAVNLPCVTGLPSAFRSASGTAPVSHITAPLGCTIR